MTFVRYGLIGSTGVVLDLVIYILLVKLGLHPIVASAISVSLAIVNNFLFNAHFNFKTKNKLFRRFINFYAVGCTGILLTTVIIFIGHDIMGFDAVFVKVLSIPPVVALQFLLNKKISFGVNVHIRQRIVDYMVDNLWFHLSLFFGITLIVISSVFTITRVLIVDEPKIGAILFLILWVILAVLLLRYIVKRIGNVPDLVISRLQYLVPISIVLFGLGWIALLNGHVQYVADSRIIIDSIARPGTLNWDVAAYLQLYPHQDGYVLLIRGLWKIFGTENFLILWFVNLIAIAFIAYTIIKITQITFRDNVVTLICGVVMCVFFPLTYYIPLVYGDIIGIALLLGGVYYLIKYIQTQDFKYTLPITLFLVTAVVFKGNISIIILSIVVFGALILLKKGRWSYLLLSLMLTILAICAQGWVKTIYESRYTLVDPGVVQPISKLKWISMGLQYGIYDKKDPYLRTEPAEIELDKTGVPGAWNWFLVSYWGDDKPTDFILASLSNMLKNPVYLFNFMSTKLAYQWASPLFGSFDSQDTHLSFRINNVNRSSVMKEVFTNNGSIRTAMMNILDVFQTLIYLLFTISIASFLRDKTQKIREEIILLLVVIVCGIGFYTLWEAMARYALPYYLLMIPFAAYGLSRLCYLNLMKFIPRTLRR